MKNKNDWIDEYVRPHLQRISKNFQNLTVTWQSQSRLTKTVLVIVFIELFLILTFFLLPNFKQTPKLVDKNKTTQQKIESKYRNRSGPLYGVSGVISAIANGLNGKKTITLKSDIVGKFKITLDSKTPIFTVIRQVTDNEVNTTKVKIEVEDLKTGVRIYLESNRDLIKVTEISPGDIKSVEVFKE